MQTINSVLDDQATRLVLPYVTDEWQDMMVIAESAGLRFNNAVAYMAGLKYLGILVNDGRNWKRA